MSGQSVLLVTGGIGSGKSFIIKALNVMGVPSYDCDSAAKRLYDEDPVLLRGMTEALGTGILTPEGRIDRRALAGLIFSDRALLQKVESLVHPAVERDFLRWKESSGAGTVVIESAILLEKPALRHLPDYVLVVTAPLETRISRVMQRDRCSRDEVVRRLASQWSDESRCAEADFIIEHDDRHAVVPALIELLEKIENGKNRP